MGLVRTNCSPSLLCPCCSPPLPDGQPHPVPSRAAQGLSFPGGPGSRLRAMMTLRVLCTSRSGTGRCERLGSSVFPQPMPYMAVGPGAAPWGCPAPVPVLGSPGEDAHTRLRMHLPRIRNAACTCHVPALLRVHLPFWGQVSAQSALAGHPLRRYPHLSAVDALLCSVPAVPVAPVAWGSCCVGPRLRLRCLSLSSSSVYSPEIPI